MKNISSTNRGVTMITLAVIIMVLIIIGSVTVVTGIEMIQSSQLTSFMTELKVLQVEVNTLYEKQKSGETVNIDGIDKEITELGVVISSNPEIQDTANFVFTESESGITSQDGYKYFSAEEIRKITGNENIELDFFINIVERTMVAYIGFVDGEEVYYTLNQLPSGLYNVEYEDPFEGDFNPPTFNILVSDEVTFDYTDVKIYGIQYEGNINEWTVHYRKQGDISWIMSENLTIKIYESGMYEIKVVSDKMITNDKIVESEIKEQYVEVNFSNVDGGDWNPTIQVNAPELAPGMTGVYWDEYLVEHEFDGSTQSHQVWYNYEENRWANAKTADGSYWVWIPRFEYKMFPDGETTGTIDINFIPVSKTQPTYGYKIHPSFEDGSDTDYINGEWDKEIPGFWVSKYEAGYQAHTIAQGTTNTIENKDDEVIYSALFYKTTNDASSATKNALGDRVDGDAAAEFDIPVSYPVFKPNTISYNVIGVSDAYNICQEIDSAPSFYGLQSSSVDSHLIKNSEWGAVAYLSYSKYGRNGEDIAKNSRIYSTWSTENEKSITGSIDSSSEYLDGDASSTGNRYGVYDLVGGVYEMTSAYIASGISYLGYGVFTVPNSIPKQENYRQHNTKYSTIYPSASWTSYSGTNWNQYNGLETLMYGDAMIEVTLDPAPNGTVLGDSEMGLWNFQASRYPGSTTPIIIRGGSYSTTTSETGIFNYNETSGIVSSTIGYRAVLITDIK